MLGVTEKGAAGQREALAGVIGDSVSLCDVLQELVPGRALRSAVRIVVYKPCTTS